MLQEDIVLPRATYRAAIFVSTSREERDKSWTNLFGYKLGESTENKKGLLLFWGKETIQTFNSSIKAFTLLFAKWYTYELQCLKILQRSIFKFSRDLIRQSNRT